MPGRATATGKRPGACCYVGLQKYDSGAGSGAEGESANGRESQQETQLQQLQKELALAL